MRLISTVGKLEAGAARARKAAPVVVGIAWSAGEERVYPEELLDGEYIASDIQLDAGAVVAGVMRSDPPPEWKVRDRVTTDAADLGTVRDAAGEIVGRVVGLDGSMVDIQMYEPPAPATAWL